jgi:hypothetical protein
MMEQPVASAADILRTAWLIGKFQGVNAATGPTWILHHQLAHREIARRHDPAVNRGSLPRRTIR